MRSPRLNTIPGYSLSLSASLRPLIYHASQPGFPPRFSLLDGPRGGQTDDLYEKGRHLERRVSRRRDADGGTSLAEFDSDAGHLPGESSRAVGPYGGGFDETGFKD